VTNVKIVLGLVTCILALVAQFYPVKFPGNYTVLVAGAYTRSHFRST
jgi:hypothetical protein